MSNATIARPRAEPGHLTGALLVLGCGFVASCGGPLFRAIQEATAWQVLFYRAGGMVVIVGLFALARAGWRPRTALGNFGWRGLLAAGCIATAFICYILALKLTTVANTLFMVACAPLVGALLGRIFLSERVLLVTWIAMGLALVGIGLMVGDGLASGQFWGNLAGFGGGAWFAAFAVVLRGARLKGRPIDSNAALVCGGVIGMTVALLVAWGQGTGVLLAPLDTVYAVTLGVVQLGLALILFTLGSPRLAAAEAMLLSLLEVVLGPLWTWLLFGERPSDLGLLGGLILLGAMVLQGAWGLRSRRRPLSLPPVPP